jgi:hypothetical protein
MAESFAADLSRIRESFRAEDTSDQKEAELRAAATNTIPMFPDLSITPDWEDSMTLRTDLDAKCPVTSRLELEDVIVARFPIDINLTRFCSITAPAGIDFAHIYASKDTVASYAATDPVFVHRYDYDNLAGTYPPIIDHDLLVQGAAGAAEVPKRKVKFTPKSMTVVMTRPNIPHLDQEQHRDINTMLRQRLEKIGDLDYYADPDFRAQLIELKMDPP